MFECGVLTWSSPNPRTVRLHEATGVFEVVENNKITSLCDINGEVIIEQGKNVLHKKYKHKVNIIERVDNHLHTYDLKTADLNSSSIFIPPLLWSKRNEMFWDSLFVNAFIGTDKYAQCIALLYKFSGTKKFSEFESLFMASPYYVETVEVDHYHTLYVMTVPAHAKEAYDKYVAGKYSEIPLPWKERILDFHGYTKKGTTGQVLFKSKKLKRQIEKALDVDLQDMELRSIPDLRIEKFNLEYYSI